MIQEIDICVIYLYHQMMKLISALKKLQNVGVPVLQTGDASIILGLSNEHGSQVLGRLAQENHIIHLSRGLWVIDLQINPLLIPDYLTAPMFSYVSLQTALYHHGMIDQISRVITVVSLARTRKIQTPLATVSVHHMMPEFFFDYEMDLKTGVKMATPEKALVDIFYYKKGLPEVEIPKSFNTKKALEMIRKIPSQARRTFAEKSFQSITSSG
jgi:predicted transcriptional regulator of viral defense system